LKKGSLLERKSNKIKRKTGEKTLFLIEKKSNISSSVGEWPPIQAKRITTLQPYKKVQLQELDPNHFSWGVRAAQYFIGRK